MNLKSFELLLLIFVNPRIAVKKIGASTSLKQTFFISLIGGFCFAFLCFNNFSNIIMLKFLDNLIMVASLSMIGPVFSIFLIFGIGALIWTIHKSKYEYRWVVATLSASFIPIIIAFIFLMLELFFYVQETNAIHFIVKLKLTAMYYGIKLFFNILIYLFKFLYPLAFIWTFVILCFVFFELINPSKSNWTK